MKESRQNLINILSTVIFSLKNNIIKYSWKNQNRCNCGVFLQAALGIGPRELQELWQKELKISRLLETDHKTWKNHIQAICPASGIPTEGVLKLLYEKGISPSDLVHLEYMSNSVILKKSGIETQRTVKYPAKIRKVKSKNFFLALFGFKDQVIIPPKTTVDKKYYFYSKKENLIKYLKAWKEILEEDLSRNKSNDLESLEKQLLQAVADEEYEKAAEIRDEITNY